MKNVINADCTYMILCWHNQNTEGKQNLAYRLYLALRIVYLSCHCKNFSLWHLFIFSCNILQGKQAWKSIKTDYICGIFISPIHTNGGTTETTKEIQNPLILNTKTLVKLSGCIQMTLHGLINNFNWLIQRWQKIVLVVVCVPIL